MKDFGLRMNLKQGKTTALRLKRIVKTKYDTRMEQLTKAKGVESIILPDPDPVIRVQQGGKLHWNTQVWHLGSTIGTDETLGVLDDVRKRFWKAAKSM